MARRLMIAALVMGLGCKPDHTDPDSGRTQQGARATKPLLRDLPEPPAVEAPREDRAWPAGNLQLSAIKLRFGVYGFDQAAMAASLGAVLGDHETTLPPLPPGGEHSVARTLEGSLIVAGEFPPPTAEEVFGSNLGQGLSVEAVEKLQTATTVAVLEFNADPESLAAVHREALVIVGELAERTQGVPYDDATSQVFSREAWTERAGRDPNDAESMLAHFQVHGVPDGAQSRLITAGLAKYGLPDLVVESVQGTLTLSMVMYINEIAKALRASPTLERAGVLRLDDGSEVRLDRAERRPHDPNNRLAEIVFEGSGSLYEMQHRVLEARYGRMEPDSYIHAQNDPELEAIAERARKELMALLPRFAKGTPHSLELLQVKATFPVPGGGTELMWVEVTGWDGTAVKGILQNEPIDLRSVHRGDEVEAPLASIADYMHSQPDGSRAGGDSEAVLERRRAGH